MSNYADDSKSIDIKMRKDTPGDKPKKRRGRPVKKIVIIDDEPSKKRRGRPVKKIVIIDDEPPKNLRNIRIIRAIKKLINDKYYYLSTECSFSIDVYDVATHKCIGKYRDDAIHFCNIPCDPDIDICFKLIEDGEDSD